MSTHNDMMADALIAEVAQLRAERDNAIAECVMHIGNAKALRAERDNWAALAAAAGMDTLQAQKERDEFQRLLGRATTERDALAALLNRVLSCTDLHGWNGEKASLLCDEIDAALAKGE